MIRRCGACLGLYERRTDEQIADGLRKVLDRAAQEPIPASEIGILRGNLRVLRAELLGHCPLCVRAAAVREAFEPIGPVARQRFEVIEGGYEGSLLKPKDGGL